LTLRTKTIDLSLAAADPRRVVIVEETAEEESARLLAESIDRAPGGVLREQLKANLKTAAADILLASFPAWKQRNFTFRYFELTQLATRTASEEAERNHIAACWQWAKDVVAVGNAAEEAVDVAASYELAAAIKLTCPGFPEPASF